MFASGRSAATLALPGQSGRHISSLQFKEDLKIPSKDPKGRYSFSAGGVEADTQGNIYVLDSVEFRVLKFDKAGDFLTSFGRRGQGPGEFQAPAQILVNAQDHIYIKDIGRMCLAEFEGSGRFIKNISGPGILLMNTRVEFDSQGNIVCGYPPLPESQEKQIYKIARFGAGFGLVKVLYERPDVFVWKVIGPRLVQAPPYTPTVVWTMGPENRLYVNYGDSYEIKVISADGRLLRTIKREHSVERISGDEKQKILESYQRLRIDPGAIPIPAVKPPLTRLFFIGDSLFVQRRRIGRVWQFDILIKMEASSKRLT